MSLDEVTGTVHSQSSTLAERSVHVRCGADGITVLTIRLSKDSDVSAIVSTVALARLLRAGEVVITKDTTR